jgi:hypothetical protein
MRSESLRMNISAGGVEDLTLLHICLDGSLTRLGLGDPP